MNREQSPKMNGAGNALLDARVLGFSPGKRALLRRLMLRNSDLPAVAESRGKRLVAYVTPQKNHSLASSDLRSFLRERLPDYMVPGAILVLEEMPLTAN